MRSHLTPMQMLITMQRDADLNRDAHHVCLQNVSYYSYYTDWLSHRLNDYKIYTHTNTILFRLVHHNPWWTYTRVETTYNVGDNTNRYVYQEITHTGMPINRCLLHNSHIYQERRHSFSGGRIKGLWPSLDCIFAVVDQKECNYQGLPEGDWISLNLLSCWGFTDIRPWNVHWGEDCVRFWIAHVLIHTLDRHIGQ